jgi:hypothetical protein
MRSMRSVRGGFISRSRGPLQKVCHGPARVSGHDCLLGPQTVCSPEEDRMNKTKRVHGLFHWHACYALTYIFHNLEARRGHREGLRATVDSATVRSDRRLFW